MVLLCRGLVLALRAVCLTVVAKEEVCKTPHYKLCRYLRCKLVGAHKQPLFSAIQIKMEGVTLLVKGEKGSGECMVVAPRCKLQREGQSVGITPLARSALKETHCRH